MPFVTAEEVAARLGRSLSAEETAQVEGFIEDVTVLIEDDCGKDFERRENQSFVIPATSSCRLPIPRRYLPYLTIDSVSFEDEVPLDDWEYRDQALWREAGWADGQLVIITGSWGYTTLPPALKVAAAMEVIRWLSVTPGAIRERTGEEEVEYGRTESSRALSEAAKTALRRFRPQAATVSLKRVC